MNGKVFKDLPVVFLPSNVVVMPSSGTASK